MRQQQTNLDPYYSVYQPQANQTKRSWRTWWCCVVSVILVLVIIAGVRAALLHGKHGPPIPNPDPH